MKKERSNLDGPKPMIINSCDVELLFLVLFGEVIMFIIILVRINIKIKHQGECYQDHL